MVKKTVSILLFFGMFVGVSWEACLATQDGMNRRTTDAFAGLKKLEKDKAAKQSQGGSKTAVQPSNQQNQQNQNQAMQALLAKMETLEEEAKWGRRFGGRWGGKENGTSHAKEVCIDGIRDVWFGEKGAKLKQAFNASFFTGMGMMLSGQAIIGGTSGFITAADKAAAGAGGSFFNAIGSKISGFWTWFTRAFWHGGAKPITNNDLKRWGGAITNMVAGLITIAQDAKTDGVMPTDFERILGKESEDHEAEQRDADTQAVPQEPVIDRNWQENAAIYLKRIAQMVSEIQFRKRFYENYDEEIVICLERLEAALVGDASTMETTTIVDKTGKKRELKVPNGGVFARIKQARSLADLASKQTITTLKLFRKHITGLLAELGLWVQEKEGKEQMHGNGGSAFGNYGFGGFDD